MTGLWLRALSERHEGRWRGGLLSLCFCGRNMEDITISIYHILRYVIRIDLICLQLTLSA